MNSSNAWNRFRRVMIYFVATVVVGSCGYSLVEGWQLADGVYMTVITLSTVGYGETHDLTAAGRVFTSLLILFGLVVMTSWTACLTSILVEGDLTGRYERRKLNRMIKKISGHTIVCGSGLLSQAVVERLVQKGMPAVVVCKETADKERLDARFPQVPVLVGDATNDLTLSRAGVARARHVVAATESEVDNLLIAISCKDLGRAISVIARSDSSQVASRMRKAGVDEVICPLDLMGARVAELLTC